MPTKEQRASRIHTPFLGRLRWVQAPKVQTARHRHHRWHTLRAPDGHQHDVVESQQNKRKNNQNNRQHMRPHSELELACTSCSINSPSRCMSSLYSCHKSKQETGEHRTNQKHSIQGEACALREPLVTPTGVGFQWNQGHRTSLSKFWVKLVMMQRMAPLRPLKHCNTTCTCTCICACIRTGRPKEKKSHCIALHCIDFFVLYMYSTVQHNTALYTHHAALCCADVARSYAPV